MAQVYWVSVDCKHKWSFLHWTDFRFIQGLSLIGCISVIVIAAFPLWCSCSDFYQALFWFSLLSEIFTTHCSVKIVFNGVCMIDIFYRYASPFYMYLQIFTSMLFNNKTFELFLTVLWSSFHTYVLLKCLFKKNPWVWVIRVSNDEVHARVRCISKTLCMCTIKEYFFIGNDVLISLILLLCLLLVKILGTKSWKVVSITHEKSKVFWNTEWFLFKNPRIIPLAAVRSSCFPFLLVWFQSVLLWPEQTFLSEFELHLPGTNILQ